MVDPLRLLHWEPLVLVPLEDLAAQHWLALCLALKNRRLAQLGACPPPTITTHGTISTVVLRGSLEVPGLKEWTKGTRGIEGRM